MRIVYMKRPQVLQKTLSDLGWLSYESFWRWWLLNALEKLVEEKSIPLIEGKLIKVRVKELVKITGMLACDIIETSSRLGLVTEGIEIEGPVESKKDDSKDVTTATATAAASLLLLLRLLLLLLLLLVMRMRMKKRKMMKTKKMMMIQRLNTLDLHHLLLLGFYENMSKINLSIYVKRNC